MTEKKVAFLAHLKKGRLHSFYGIPAGEKIPVTLLKKTVTAAKKPGSSFTNPTSKGKRIIHIPKSKACATKLEREAQFPLDTARWKKK